MRWKRLALISASFGAAFGITIASIFGLVMWYQSRPKLWNSDALKAKFSGLELSTQPSKDSYVLRFSYDVQNYTKRNYEIIPANLTVMADLTDGRVLSKDFGNYQTSDVVVDGPAFIPPQGTVRITLRTSYQYPPQFNATEKDDMDKVTPSADRRLKELSGFVIFDPQNHYRINLPGGWNDWERLKSK